MSDETEFPGDPADALIACRIDELRAAAWEGVSAAFEALGRVLLCLDGSRRILHASAALDRWLGDGAAEAVVGQPIEAVLGQDLFGEQGSLRPALVRGERREGWQGVARWGDESALVSLTVSPMVNPDNRICDPRVSFIVVLRPAEKAGEARGATVFFEGLVGRSPALERIVSLISSLRTSDATILISGASGTGKEVVARAIHAHSARRNRPFVAVNCGAIPEALLEAEMFGHVRGAFTGAVRDRPGRFEAAGEGTIFLDEVGELALPLQVKLLRVLQERTFERVGENRTRTLDARIIAATNRDLQAAIRAGRFREDLYYRLRVVPIDIPPLCERREDVAPLAQHLMARVGARHGRALRLSPDALRLLIAYDWPGNVRELENALEHATAVCAGQTIMPGDLPAEVQHLAAPPGRPAPSGAPSPEPRPTANPPPAPPGALSAPAAEDDETRALRAALEAHRWNRQRTARALGISRTTLWRKMRELRLSD